MYDEAVGDMDKAITIRTAVIKKDGKLHIQTGAKIVYDSQPDNKVGREHERGHVTSGNAG